MDKSHQTCHHSRKLQEAILEDLVREVDLEVALELQEASPVIPARVITVVLTLRRKIDRNQMENNEMNSQKTTIKKWNKRRVLGFESKTKKAFGFRKKICLLFCSGHYFQQQNLQLKFKKNRTNFSKNQFFRPRKKNACFWVRRNHFYGIHYFFHPLPLDSSSRYVVWYEHCINYSSLKSFFCCFAAFHLKFIRRIFLISLSFVPHWEGKQAKFFPFTCFFGSSFMVITPQNHTDKKNIR